MRDKKRERETKESPLKSKLTKVKAIERRQERDVCLLNLLFSFYILSPSKKMERKKK